MEPNDLVGLTDTDDCNLADFKNKLGNAASLDEIFQARSEFKFSENIDAIVNEWCALISESGFQ